MKYDYDILFEFIPEEDKKYFWDNVHLNMGKDRIVATYRKKISGTTLVSPFEERVIIPLSDYDARVKQKERDNKLNNLGLC